MRRSHTGSLPYSSGDAFLPAPRHTRPGPQSFPASPRVFPQKRKTDARPAVILGLQGSLPEPPATPAKTQNFVCVLFRVGFPKQPAEPAALTEPTQKATHVLTGQSACALMLVLLLPAMPSSRLARQTGGVTVTHGPCQRQAASCCSWLPWIAIS